MECVGPEVAGGVHCHLTGGCAGVRVGVHTRCSWNGTLLCRWVVKRGGVDGKPLFWVERHCRALAQCVGTLLDTRSRVQRGVTNPDVDLVPLLLPGKLAGVAVVLHHKVFLQAANVNPTPLVEAPFRRSEGDRVLPGPDATGLGVDSREGKLDAACLRAGVAHAVELCCDGDVLRGPHLAEEHARHDDLEGHCGEGDVSSGR